MMKGRMAAVLLVILALIPFSARADAGTPLMWATLLHLVIGNALIAVLEGLILAKVFKLGLWRCLGLMVAANYFSSWVGAYAIDQVSAHLRTDIYNAWKYLWGMVVLTYLLTLVLEWPFVFFCFKKDLGRGRRSLLGNVLVNTVSYVLLFGWYWSASGTGLFQQVKIVGTIHEPKNAAVYYISAADGNACALDLATGRSEEVAKLHCVNVRDRLLCVREPDTNGPVLWRICEQEKAVVVASNLQVLAPYEPYEEDQRGRDNWMHFGKAATFDTNSDWDFATGFWPVEGLRGENKKTGQRLHVCLETPFFQWNARNATLLPGGMVIYQLGDDQICILDATRQEMALLARGYGPVVVLKN